MAHSRDRHDPMAGSLDVGLANSKELVVVSASASGSKSGGTPRRGRLHDVCFGAPWPTWFTVFGIIAQNG